MAVFGAGDRAVYDKVKPVLQASFSNVMYTGGIGTAMIPKVRRMLPTRQQNQLHFRS